MRKKRGTGGGELEGIRTEKHPDRTAGAEGTSMSGGRVATARGDPEGREGSRWLP